MHTNTYILTYILHTYIYIFHTLSEYIHTYISDWLFSAQQSVGEEEDALREVYTHLHPHLSNLVRSSARC